MGFINQQVYMWLNSVWNYTSYITYSSSLVSAALKIEDLEK
jgi:hypothetical protein